MPDIVITEFMDEDAVSDLARDFAVMFDPDLVDRPEDLPTHLADCRALIVRNRTQVRGPMLQAAPNLKVVGRLGVGLDNIDLPVCEDRGILVRPATGANSIAVAEYVIAGILMLRRAAYFSSDSVRTGAWPRNALMGREASGATLGLIGFGSIARETAVRAVALGMTVVAYDPMLSADDPAWGHYGVAPRPLETLLAESDAVSLHVPLTDATRHLIDMAALARMKPDSVLINAARGGVVDERALAEALTAGRLGAAMLDVFEREPLLATAGFDNVPNLILTPHIAGLTAEANARTGHMVAAAVRQVLEAS